MLFKCACEFRGFKEKVVNESKKFYCNLEDEEGSSLLFPVDTGVDVKAFKKGDKVIAIIEYNNKYNSLKVISLNLYKKGDNV